MEPYVKALKDHYRKLWTGACDAYTWPDRRADLGPDFCVARFYPSSVRPDMWTYATVGMSAPIEIDGKTPLGGVELHLFSVKPVRSLADLLAMVAHYHRTNARLGLHHTVNFGLPWLPFSRCTYGFVSLPYLDGPKLETFRYGEHTIRCLWLIPITYEEREFKKSHGTEALESAFERESLNYLDPNRRSVV